MITTRRPPMLAEVRVLGDEGSWNRVFGKSNIEKDSEKRKQPAMVTGCYKLVVIENYLRFLVS